MRTIPLQSSQLSAVAYDQATEKLYACFNNGAWYQYDDVPNSVVLAVILADSQGKAFQTKIKDAHYTYEKLEGEPEGLHV